MTSTHTDQGNQQQPQSKRSQWLWFLGLWLGGLLTVSTLGYLIKFLMSLI